MAKITIPYFTIRKCPACLAPAFKDIVEFHYKGVVFKVHRHCRTQLKIMLQHHQYHAVDIILGLDHPTFKKSSFWKQIRSIFK